MKKRKIVLISGLITAGKTTTSHELAKVLPNWIFIDVWKIKEMFEPLGLKDRSVMIKISKSSMIHITREVLRKMQRNIILQEAKPAFVKRHLRNDLKKYNYEIYSFFLVNNLDDAIRRDKQREKPTMNIGKRAGSDKEWIEKGRTKPVKGDVIINTSEHSIKEVRNIILKTIREKPKKHPYARAIRRSW